VAFDNLHHDITLDVKRATQEAQWPDLHDGAFVEFYFKPTADVLKYEAAVWSSALESRNDSIIARFAARYAASRFAADARDWLARPRTLALSSSRTNVSPDGIDNSWNYESVHVAFLPSSTGLEFERLTSPAVTTNVDVLSDKALGRVASGTRDQRAGTEKVAADAVVAATHETVVTGKTFLAKQRPDVASATLYTIPVNARLAISGIDSSSLGQWARASLVGKSDEFYIELKAGPDKLQVKELGKPLFQDIVPPSKIIGGALDEAALLRAMRRAKQGNTILWVSLATAKSDSAQVADIGILQLAHAWSLLRKAGIDGKTITAVAGASDMTSPGVRVRFFGH
jgi:hypothetical protein